MSKQDLINRAKVALKKGIPYGLAGAAIGGTLGAGYSLFDGHAASNVASGALHTGLATGLGAALAYGVLNKQKDVNKMADKSVANDIKGAVKATSIVAPMTGVIGAGLGAATALQGL